MKNLKKIFNSYLTIIISLIILIIILLIFNLYLIKSTKIYTFSGTSENCAVLSGTVYIGYNINRFQAPQIICNDLNITLKSGKIGYYISETPISIIEINEELKLKNIINSYDFSFTEMHRKALKLSKKNISKLKELTFKVQGESNDGKIVEINVPLNVIYLGK